MQHRTDVAPTGARDHLTRPAVEGVEVGKLLARGGTSEVWAGVRVADGRPMAVKVLHADPEAVELAAREAAVTARAANAHVVAVEAVLPLDDGRVALLMPQLRGGSLDGVVRARGHLGPGEVVTVLAPIASALGRLHGMGVVHGDVSPGNVLLDLDGRPVLADLGLGQVLGEVSPGVWGTEGYVAPEVLLGADPSPAADVYAVGALGWLCLSGAVPGPPGLRPSLQQVNRAGEGSAAVVEVVEAAVDADPTTRPDADTLAWALFQAAEPAPLDLVRGGDETSAVTYRLRAAAGRAPDPTPSGRTAPRRPRHARVRSRSTAPWRAVRARSW
ncbi:MAG: serine/threonine-protein kinase, partial [Phycicoccus sp.]